MAKSKTRPSMVMMDKKYQAQDDLRTLQRAEEIKRDTSRVNAAKREAREQMQALAKVSKGK